MVSVSSSRLPTVHLRVGSIVAERIVADKGKRAPRPCRSRSSDDRCQSCSVLRIYISAAVTWSKGARWLPGIAAVWGAVALLLVKLWVPALPALPDTGLKGSSVS